MACLRGAATGGAETKDLEVPEKDL